MTKIIDANNILDNNNTWNKIRHKSMHTDEREIIVTILLLSCHLLFSITDVNEDKLEDY
jgi:hypothetical protein